MAWIESHQSLQRHPKTLRLAKLLKAPRVTVIGHLHCLWWWALDYAQDGALARYDDATIAEAAEWKRDPAAFVAALSDSGWLDEGREIHDWDDYTARYFALLAANKAANKDPEHQRAAGKARAEKASRNADGSFAPSSREDQPEPATVQPEEPAGTSHTSPTDLDLPTLTYQTNQTTPTEPGESSKAAQDAAAGANGTKTPTTRQLHLLGEMEPRAAIWSTFTPGALLELNGIFGTDTVTEVLAEAKMRLVENGFAPDKPYPWVRETCEKFAAERAS